MTKIIDNSEMKLSTALNGEIRNVGDVAIASAYFNVRGFHLLKDSLYNKPLKLLLGKEPGSNIAYQDEILAELEKELLENENDMLFFSEVKETLEYFKKPEVMVKIVNNGFLHGKAYIGASPYLSSVKNGFAVTGSSNFTYGGLYSNKELNMLTTDRETVEELFKWFDKIWSDSKDFKDEFLSFLSNYVTAHFPFEIVAKALYETLKDRLGTAETINTIKGLYPHQKLSVAQAWEILNKYNGVIIADPVGIGKTRVGLALAHRAIQEGMKPMVIARKTLLETTWKTEMNEVISLELPSINTERISKEPDILSKKYSDKNFIIIDEAHDFRSSSSLRFEGLVNYLKEKDRKLVLITATPINNSLMDLYNLLSLFVDDDAVPDISHSLKGFFTENQKKLLNGERINLDPLLKKFVVRISRETAKKLTETIQFPSRIIDNKGTSYPLSPSPDVISNYIDRLTLPYYDLAVEKQVKNLSLPDGKLMKVEQQIKNKEKLKELVKSVTTINYFKRLESSVYSLKESLKGLENYIEMTIKVANTESKFIPPKFKSRVEEKGDNVNHEDYLNDENDNFDLSRIPKEELEKLILSENEKNWYINNAKKDLEIIKELLSLIAEVDDKKLKVLTDKLLTINIQGNNGVIIFTSYYDTAEYLYSELSKNDHLKSKLLLITGEKSRGPEMNDRTEIINYFMDNGGILISTDVLSAGQNLQNAQYMINYDLPWNPVILIQRTGRIDRLRSPYDRIYIMNISPLNRDEEDPSSIEHFIKLMAKLTKKIEGIRQAIGSDVSILGEEPMPKDFNTLLEIIKGNNKMLDNLEETGINLGIISWESPLDIYETIKEQLGEEKIKAIPIGSGAYKIYDKNGIFVLYRSGENGKYSYHWILKFENGDLITDEMKIIEILLQQPHDNKGETINYDELKILFNEARETLKKELEEKSKKYIGRMRKDFRTIINYVQNDSSLLKYAPMLMEKQGDLNLIKILKDALDKGKLSQELEKRFPNTVTQKLENNKNSSNLENLHRIVWCRLKKLAP